LIVYGDHPRRQDAHERVAGMEAALRGALGRPAGLVRHAALAGALIEAGEIAQGIADEAFAARGVDADCPATEAATALLRAVAAIYVRSWRTGYERVGAFPEAPLAALRAAFPCGEITTKRAEGFAFYALYPEAYALAAEGLPAGARVIGLRSIGTALGAVVAAAAGAGRFVTLRPVGHPFGRVVAMDGSLAASLLDDPAARFAVVDEGPGLSGSSFGAVVDALAARGVAEDRIHLLPGHDGGPGPEASPESRARWGRLSRRPALFERAVLDAPRPEGRLARWAADRLGPATGPLEDLSGGAWRRLSVPEGRPWPPVHPFLERRKFLHRTAEGAWLLRFVGLGRAGEEAAGRARMLHEAGLAPAVGGLLHGFLALRWEEAARPLDPGAVDRAALVAHLGRYLAFRAVRMPASRADGAAAAALLDMARHNVAEGLGGAAAGHLDRWRGDLGALDASVRRVVTDNRMHAWEWLRLPGGRLLKADATDHAASHDLIGCGDIAWDVAGATVELGLTGGEAAGLRDDLARRTGRAVDPALLAFLTPCYLAFQLGLHAMAARAWGGGEEAARAEEAVRRYAAHLRDAL